MKKLFVFTSFVASFCATHFASVAMTLKCTKNFNQHTRFASDAMMLIYFENVNKQTCPEIVLDEKLQTGTVFLPNHYHQYISIKCFDTDDPNLICKGEHRNYTPFMGGEIYGTSVIFNGNKMTLEVEIESDPMTHKQIYDCFNA